MGLKHEHDKKRGLKRESKARWSSHQLSMFEDWFRSKIGWEKGNL